MTIGTRSVLFGAHQFLIHPWFVAAGWWQLYGFPWDPRLWVAFFVHDLGYLGKPNMDGPEGETHPHFGADIMAGLFDGGAQTHIPKFGLGKWGAFCLLHSRYYAKSLGLQPSRLCMADKLAIALTPAWLYLPLVRMTGELAEYRAHAAHRVNASDTAEERAAYAASDLDWYTGVQSYCRRWAWAHKDGNPDTWTANPAKRATVGQNGVWR